MEFTLAAARELDRTDEIAWVGELFEAQEGTIFLDANSIGPAAKAVRGAANGLVDDWIRLRRRGWSARPWLDLPLRLGDAIAPLIGAGPGETVFCDSTTLNQYKAVSHCLAINPERRIILSQNGNFPTDLHVLQGIVRASAGRLTLKRVDSEDEAIANLDSDVAVAALSHVDYRSGTRWNMARVNDAAIACGALTVWDLSHSAGAVPVNVKGDRADFAIGCGYKYLCAGPGGPAYIWARPGLADAVWPSLQGWMGHADIFGFAPDYEPHAGIKRFLTGTPLVGANELAAPLIDIWPKIPPQKLWAKHRSLTDFLTGCLRQHGGPLGLAVTSPDHHADRGGHVSFTAPGAGSVVEALIEHGVISSFRKPNSIRFGVSALVISHQDCFEAVQRLCRILESEIWREPRYAKVSV